MSTKEAQWILLVDFLVNRKQHDSKMVRRGTKVKNPFGENTKEQVVEYSGYNDIIYDWTLQLCDELDQAYGSNPNRPLDINLFTWVITWIPLQFFRIVVSSDLQRIHLKRNLEKNDTLKPYEGGIIEDDIKDTFRNKKGGEVDDHIYAFATILFCFGLAAPHNDPESKVVKQSLEKWNFCITIVCVMFRCIKITTYKIPDMSHLLQEVVYDIGKIGKTMELKAIKRKLKERRMEVSFLLSFNNFISAAIG